MGVVIKIPRWKKLMDLGYKRFKSPNSFSTMSFSLGHSLFTSASSTFMSLPKDNNRSNEANNNQIMMGTSDKIEEIWNKNTFKTDKLDMALSLNSMKLTSWIKDNISKADDDPDQEPEKLVQPQEHVEEPVLEFQETPKEDQSCSPSHHARRPMNAFLIFCKKHRPIVRDRFPNLENRGVTKILGEWWSLLEEEDKMAFTNLANEYKDAFLSANPDFKWYKLPAPPLRTLTVRPPSCITKLPSPQSSPSHTSLKIFNEFTPGKLADESQLGSLSSLLNNSYSSLGYKISDCCESRKHTSMVPITEMGENNNKIEKCDTSLQTPLNSVKAATLHPKPIKKRLYPKISESNTKEVSKNILNVECNEKYTCFQKEHQHQPVDTMTNQDIVDKVVDNLFVEKDIVSNGQTYIEDKTRKSGRQCKGKRYQKFMVEGKLLGNKKDTKLTQNKMTNILNETSTEFKAEMITPNLENTIKRLAERTKVPYVQNDDEDMLALSPKDEKEDIYGPETSESLPSTNFNLDLKISNLPCLGYDAFIQKKRESKKRKLRKVSSENWKNGEKKPKKEQMLVGSKKRKNKQSITHLEKKEEVSNFNDLLGLATLAEIAANTQKINES